MSFGYFRDDLKRYFSP